MPGARKSATQIADCGLQYRPWRRDDRVAAEGAYGRIPDLLEQLLAVRVQFLASPHVDVLIFPAAVVAGQREAGKNLLRQCKLDVPAEAGAGPDDAGCMQLGDDRSFPLLQFRVALEQILPWHRLLVGERHFGGLAFFLGPHIKELRTELRRRAGVFGAMGRRPKPQCSSNCQCQEPRCHSSLS